jgi:flagellum-specific peptidoglycan hydrolase FlgJ
MEDREQRLREVARIAVAMEAQTGCPAVLLITQWALESEWGAKPVGNFNVFGIKRAERHRKFCVVTTEEWFTEAQIADWNRRNPDRPARRTGRFNGDKIEVQLDDFFADYDSLADACRDYAWLITEGGPYRAAWLAYRDSHDVHALIEAVAKVYATAPSYATLAINISAQSNVAHAIAVARQDGTINA